METNRTDSPQRRIIDNAFNQGDLAALDDLLSVDGIEHHDQHRTTPSKNGLKGVVAMFRGGFADLHVTVDDEIREGDKVATHFTIRGTHTGLFLGNPPTGKRVAVPGILFARNENGRMKESWTVVDNMGMMQQLGLVPPP